MSNSFSFDGGTTLPLELENQHTSDMEPSGVSAEIQLPSTTLLLEGEYHRVGDDLLINGPEGESSTLEGYFASSQLATLTSPDGKFILPETVELLLASDSTIEPLVMVAGPIVPGGIPGAGAAGSASSIGNVGQITGKVTAKNKAGVVRTLEANSPIFLNDVIKTADGGMIKVVFVDKTTFQLGEKANLVLNKYVYNPDAGKGTIQATVLGGAFKFKSGGLGHLSKAGQYAKIKTPSAVIGIRGSELQGEVTEDGQTTVVHTSGILAISDAQGNGTVTLLEPGMATIINFGESPEPVFKASQEILDRLNSQLPPVLPGNNVESLGDAFGPKPISTVLGDMLPSASQDIKAAGFSSEDITPKIIDKLTRGDFATYFRTPSLEPELRSGIVLLPDSPIEGINYQSSSGYSGTTNEQGYFLFKMGDSVTFSIGDIELATVDMDQTQQNTALITPKELALAMVTAEQAADQDALNTIQSNLVSFFGTLDAQTVDSDGNPETNITIDEVAQASAVAKSIDFTLSESEFEHDPNLIAYLKEAKGTTDTVPLIDRDTAWENYYGTVGKRTELEQFLQNLNADGSGLFLPDAEQGYAYGMFLLQLDSPVAGITYHTTSGRSGTTDANGHFMFAESSSEIVTFSIGNITLGSITMNQTSNGNPLVTPQELASATNTTNATSIESNIVLLLNTLNSHENTNTGVNIEQSVLDNAQNSTINLNVPTEEFVQISDLDTLLQASKGATANELFNDRDSQLATYYGADGKITQLYDLFSAVNSESASFLYAAEDQAFSFEISEELFQSPGNTLTYSTSDLPSWLTFDPQSRMLSGTPLNDHVLEGQVSPFTVSVESSSGASGSVNFIVLLGNVNDAPVVSLPYDEMVAFIGIPAYSGWTVFADGLDNPGKKNLEISPDALYDVDPNDTLTSSATLIDGSPLPDWLIYNSGTFTTPLGKYPDSGDLGEYEIVVTATDALGATGTDNFLLKIQDPRAPMQMMDIPQQVATEDIAFEYIIPVGTFEDPSDDNFIYSVKMSGGGNLPEWLTFTSSEPSSEQVGHFEPVGRFSGIPDNDAVGTLQLTILATEVRKKTSESNGTDENNETDENDISGFATFSLVIENVNDAPERAFHLNRDNQGKQTLRGA